MSDGTQRFASRFKSTQAQTPASKVEDVELGAARPVPTTAAAATTTTGASAPKTPASATTPSAPLMGAPVASRYPPPPPPVAPVPQAVDKQPDDIPNEPAEESEDEDPNEPVETEMEKRSVAKMPQFVFLLLDLVIAFCIMLPYLFLLWFCDFPTYNIIDVKGPDDVLNPFMEFFRWSLFGAVAYASYSVLDFTLGSLPTLILKAFNGFGMFKSKRIKRQIGYLRNIHPYMTACVFFLVLLWLGGIFVYSKQVVGPAIKLGPLSGAAASGAAVAVTSEPIQDSRYYFERFLILAAILAGAVAFEKYLMEAIRAKFHRMALASRIKDINYRQRVVLALYFGVNQGQPHITALPRPTSGPQFEDIYLVEESRLQLTSVARARSIASKIFEGLRGNKNEVTKDDVGKIIKPPELDMAFETLDVNKNGSIDEEEFTEFTVDLFEDHQNIKASQIGNARIVGKLDRLMLVIAVILGLALAMPFFDVGLGKAWATFGVISTAFGFMFQNAGKVCFEALIFVFVEHAFDVGDRVTVDGENMVVQNIEIFTTRFVRWDGLIVYAPNSVLSGKYIYNVRRSGMQSEQISAHIAAKTTTDQLRQVLEKLKTKTAAEIKNFTGFVDIVEFNVQDEDKMEVTFTVQYKSNFQNQAQRNARKSLFNGLLKDTLSELSIEYYPSG